MKYEEIKIGDVFKYMDDEETVIHKSDKHRIIVTIDDDIISSTWKEDDLHFLKPIKEELPEEGLLVGVFGSLAYKLSDGSGYGFGGGHQSGYFFNKRREFPAEYWKPATPEQEKKFVEMLKKECEKHGLFKDTKLSECGINSNIYVNSGIYSVTFTVHEAWNKNGLIFHKGKFATPLKEEAPTLELVSKACLDLSKFGVTIEQVGNMLMINPINKDE